MITIALPAFKTRFLREAISSLLSQTRQDFELVVVDDASPEPVADVVAEFHDPRIRYVRNPKNLGMTNLVSNWNRCLELATGEWFVLASDDDVYQPEFLAELMALASHHPGVDVFHTRVAVIDSDGVVVELTQGCPELESASDFLWHRIAGGRAGFIPEFLFRTEALRRNRGFVDFPAAWGSDVATCAREGRRGGVGCVNLPLLHWRRSGINITTSDRYRDQKMQGLNLFISWLFEFLERDSSLPARLALKFLPEFRSRNIAYLSQGLGIPTLVGYLVGLGNEVPRGAAARALVTKLNRMLFR